MPANIEIKAILHDRDAARSAAARLADSGPETIHQEDVFFRCADARLAAHLRSRPRRAEIWIDPRIE